MALKGTPLSDEETRRLLHELQVHQEELAQQNDELQSTHAALAESLLRYLDLYEEAPLGLVTLDRHGVVQDVNRYARGLLGDGSSLVGRPFEGCVAEASRPLLRRLLATPEAPIGAREIEIFVERPPASRRVISLDFRRHLAGDESTLLTLTDVTARRQAEADLARMREILELSNQIARIGYWDLDLDRDQLSWSAVTREIHGVEADYTPTVSAAIQFYKEGEHRSRIQAAVTTAREQGQPFDLELQILTPLGQERWVRAIGIPRMIDGRCRYLYGTFQDIDSARLAQNRAETANRSKSDFLARMSHDLRTPLNAVLGFSQLLELDSAVRASQAATTQVRYIYDAGKHLLAMIDDVLDLARIEAGGLHLSAEALDAGQLVLECLLLTQTLAAKSQVAVHIGGHHDGHHVRADRTRLRQVLVNLVTNAIKYNHEGGEVDLTIGADAAQVTIAIRDTGPGLTSEQRAALFQPFNRLGAERGEVEGTGLGLVIAQQLVGLMDGALEVQSTPGAGSIFTLHLPMARSEARVAAPARPGALLSAPSRPLLVLYIEDHKVNVEVMRSTLAQRKHVLLEVATSGESGLEAARRLRPDLVLLDLGLPLLDGTAVLRLLRADPSLAAIPCVAVSANAMESDIQRALRAGFTDYITKPFAIDRVLALIDRLHRTAS